MHKITLLRDFEEDSRTSMDVYADNLAKALRTYSKDLFAVDEVVPKMTTSFGNGVSGDGFRMRFSRYVSYPLQARKKKTDIYHIIEHGYSHLAGVLNPQNVIVTVHDLIPVLRWLGRIPGMASSRRPILSQMTLRFLRRARFVVAISERTRMDVLEHCNCAPDQVITSHYGLDARFRQHPRSLQARFRRALNLPDQPFRLILITGHQEYKNHKSALEVFKNVKGRSPLPVKLVRVGIVTPEWEILLESSGLRNDVICLPFVKHDEMVHLYNSVDCLLFPSWYEGFGWPPLEAMACGLPVVTSNTASLPEVTGNAAFARSPNDIDGLASDVITILQDKERREVLQQRGRERAKLFTWEAHIARILPLYKTMISESSR